jgi:Spy/CpxP family protein refolding chaperone
MRKLMMIAAICGLSQVSAQEVKECKRLNKVETYLKDSVKITAEQQRKIAAIHSNYCPKMQAIKSSEKSKEVKKEEMKALNKEMKAEYKTVLSKDQLKAIKEGAKNKKANKNAKSEKGHNGKKLNADSMTAKMALKLKLTAEQKAKVHPINVKFVNDMQALKTKKEAGVSKSEIQTARKELTKAHRENIRMLLTPEQRKLVKEEKKGMREERKNKK